MSNAWADDLFERIRARTVGVAVIGLGYVGLPMAVEFAKAGAKTVGVDVDQEKIERINRGESYILDVKAEELAHLNAQGLLRATADYAALKEADAIFICVPTPYTKMKAPDLSYVEDASRGLAAHLRPGQLVVLQSTTYPGTTEEVVLPLLESSGLKVGRDFFLAFSPERIDPGNKEYGARNTPKVVGGIDEASTRLASALFELFIEPGKIHQVSTPKVAEMTKLLENIFRSVNIALVNELAKLSDRMGIDIWEVLDAAATKPFGFMPFYPGPGVGGHCIPVDPYYLSWKAREYDFYTKFIELAAEVNQSMPFYTANKVIEALNRHGKPLLGSRILVLGATFKKDIDDARNSPTVEILKILLAHGAQASYHDPYVPRITFNEPVMGPVGERVLESIPLSEGFLEGMDCTLIAVAHSCFDIPWIVRHSRLIVDAQNATKGIREGRERIVRL
ncbi:MAG: nucleotide sugar dehydrogenase [candidate division NC10 bacterium]|nr:nucleotide sugar dehydrogenase [candidate division NC10 bacterium]